MNNGEIKEFSDSQDLVLDLLPEAEKKNGMEKKATADPTLDALVKEFDNKTKKEKATKKKEIVTLEKSAQERIPKSLHFEVKKTLQEFEAKNDDGIQETKSELSGAEKKKEPKISREDLQIAQLGTDKTMHQYYANIEKKKYGSCILEQDEKTKNTFQLMYYLEDEKADIGYNHSVFDLYNLMAMDHFEGYETTIKALSGFARKLVICRARTLQCVEIDENSVKDYHIYDHLLDNWTDLITADFLLLHHYHKRPKYRIFERRVLSWIASRMYNKPKIY